MNLRTIGLIAILALLVFVTARVLADVKTERIKLDITTNSIEEVEQLTGTIEGVIQTEWNDETEELEIIFEQDKTSLQEIEQTISDAGFETINNPSSEKDSITVSEKIKKSNKTVQ